MDWIIVGKYQMSSTHFNAPDEYERLGWQHFRDEFYYLCLNPAVSGRCLTKADDMTCMCAMRTICNLIFSLSRSRFSTFVRLCAAKFFNGIHMLGLKRFLNNRRIRASGNRYITQNGDISCALVYNRIRRTVSCSFLLVFVSLFSIWIDECSQH